MSSSNGHRQPRKSKLSSGRTISFKIKTFGCKVNQYDSQLLLEHFVGAGWQLAENDAAADVCLVNACTVTAAADRRARQALRRERKRGARLLVAAGCLPGSGSGLEADLVVREKDKRRLPSIVAELLGQPVLPRLAGISSFLGRQRAPLLVQTGCECNCTYCIVPSRRGRERSRPLAQVLAEARRLAKSGHRELVLSGVRLGGYRPAGDTASGLSELARRILEACPDLRLRFSSIDPGDLDAELAELVCREQRICPHLHLPAQSGSSQVLSRMRRDYDRREYLDLVGRLSRGGRKIELSTDMIVGFPGETEQEFRSTLSLVRQCHFLKVHAFRYSARPGTAAATFPEQVKAELKKERMDRLGELAGSERRKRLFAMRGGKLEVLVEKALGPGRFIGRAENYAEVALNGPGIVVGSIYTAKVVGLEDDILVGEAEPV